MPPGSYIMNSFDPDRVMIGDLAESGGGSRVPQANCLERLLEIMAVSQTLPTEPLGRQYQREILDHGRFNVPSPFSGDPVTCSYSIILKDKTVFFYFEDDPP